MNVTLGDFDLQRLLGRGGMGEVWRATHRPTDLDVAVKVVTADLARQDRYHVSFRTEVQAMARLNHEGIAVVLDYGRVLPQAHEASRGHFAVDAPYLVMELCDETLATVVSELNTWDLARDTLLQLLEALGHAHARAVVHRDIKPQNVLVQLERGERRYKLADFGLAHPIDDPDYDPGGSGTPKYMAPEQILGSQRDQGPWTDLYAVGCLARWLVGGSAPFEDDNSALVLRGHLFEEPPTLQPRFAVPDGLSEWLDLLLAKDPVQRLSKAADAKYLLERLDADGGIVEASARAVHSDLETAPTVVDATTDESTATRNARRRRMEEQRRRFEQQLASQPKSRHSFAPPHPEEWRRRRVPNHSMKVVGAGISLYGLRPVPMVDRDAERDAIWTDLGRVVRRGEPHVVILEGQAGSGKSRLAKWVCERADEYGAAHVLRAVHSPLGGANDGVGPMVANHLRLGGLERPDVLRQLERFMSPDGSGREFDIVDVLALADLALSDGRWSETASARERNAVLCRFIEQASWDRPVVLWIDDAQWGRDAIELASAVCQRELAVLLLLTIRAEALPDRTLERRALDELRELAAHVRELSIGPLSSHDHRELIQQMLQLDDDVASNLAARTQGNPLFAVQLVGDWVERGVLIPGPGGFELRPGAERELPESIHNVWSRRIDSCVQRYLMRATAGLRGGPDDIERALWAASVLGQEVEFREWETLCAAVDADASHRLLEELVRLHLAERTPTGFCFTHGMLAESLIRRAEEGGALRELHREAARMLEQLDRRGDASRIAEHYLAAEAWADALEPLLVAAELLSRTGEFGAALALDARYEEVLDAQDEPHDSANRVRGWVRRARTHLMTGAYDDADRDIESAVRVLDAIDDDAVHGEVLWTQMLRARHHNETTAGAELAREALALYRKLDDRKSVARTLNKLGELSRRAGDLARSIEYYDRGREEFEELDERFELAWSLLGLGTSQRHAGKLEPAAGNIARALQLFSELGSRLGLGNAHNELGELERAAGNFAAAEKHYRTARQLWGRRGHTELAVLDYNIVLTLMQRQQWSQASALAQQVFDDASERGHRALVMLCRGALACCAAAAEDWRTAQEHFDRFVALHEDLDFIEPDIGELALLFAEETITPVPDIAARGLSLARKVFRQLSDARLDRVEELYEQLG